MNRDQSLCVVTLSGGLGNQLFQLVAGMSLKRNSVLLDLTSGAPRTDSSGIPDLVSFKLPADVHVQDFGKPHRLRSYFFQLLLKTASKRFQKKRMQCLLVHLKRLIASTGLFLSDGVGFDSRLHFLQKPQYVRLIGTFHTYKYAQETAVVGYLKELVLVNPSEFVNEFSNIAIAEKPIILHVRLADYLSIDELGILDKSYYVEGLKIARESYPDSRVWLFSDDIDLALKILDGHLPSNTRVFSGVGQSAAETLEVMRSGFCYVISNSTFGWWAAFLARNQECKVICPEFWFKTHSNPDYLLPTRWIKVSNREVD